MYPDEAFAALSDFKLLVGIAKTRARHELLRATPFKPRCKTFRRGDSDESISQQSWPHSCERVGERRHGRRISRRCQNDQQSINTTARNSEHHQPRTQMHQHLICETQLVVTSTTFLTCRQESSSYWRMSRKRCSVPQAVFHFHKLAVMTPAHPPDRTTFLYCC